MAVLMRVGRPIVPVVVLLLGFLSFERFAYADDPSMAKPTKAAAREKLSAGNKLYRVREFEKAVEEYKAGVLIEDVPVFHYNLGQCYRQLNRYEEAVWHYERFVDRGNPAGQLRGAVEAFLTQMKAELQRKTEVVPAPQPEPEKPVEPPPPKTVTVTIPGEPWYRDRVGWIVSGVGLVAVGAGGWFLLDAKGIEDDANAEPLQSERQRLRDDASSRRVIGGVVGGVGLGLVVAGIVKLAIRPSDREETWTVQIGVTSDSVFVIGRF